MLTQVEQPCLVTTQHLDHLVDRLRAAAHGIASPGIEKAFGSTLVAVTPELGRVLFGLGLDPFPRTV